MATIMHALFDVGTLRVARGSPDNLLKIATDTPARRALDS